MSDNKENDSAIEAIVRLLGARTGLTFRADQRESTKQGIQRAMARSNITEATEYARLLQFDVDALDNLIVELTVGETYFFREPHQFEYLRSHVLPEILERRGHQHVVRIWSAGCASGEEPYSLAMLCQQEGLAGQCSILATDISSEALDKAKKATYGKWSLRARNRMSADEYLHQDGQRYHVHKQIRRLVHFEFVNLALDVYPSFATATMALDLILCRNVLIYFDADTIRRVANRLFESLADGGWLITASGDPPLSDHAPFETVVTDHGIFCRRPLKRVVAVHVEDDTTSTEDLLPVDVPAAESSQMEIPDAASSRLDSRELDSEDDAPGSRMEGAEQSLSRGDYQRAAELTEQMLDDPAASVLHLKAIANMDTERAIRGCEMLTKRHPLSAELHYLHAVLLLELNLDVDAVQAAQRAIYLDGSLAIGHFLLGSILQRRGALQSAQRAFRNARDICRNRPANEPLPLAEEETAGQLAQAAEIQLTAIQAALGSKP